MPADAARILVVDDSGVSRKLLARAVTTLGHTATEAPDGQSALDQLRARPHDAVLLDIEMPGMDGFAVLGHVKSDPQLRDLPVIIISGVEDVESIARGIEMGAEDFLPKSFDHQVLRARLRSALDRKRLRDLERAYLEQEVTLHEAQKLASLGKLAAGLSHELNNPSAAARRAAGHLAQATEELESGWAGLAAASLDDAQRELLARTRSEALARALTGPPLDPLDEADVVDELSDWLDALGADGPRHAPVLAAAGYRPPELAGLLHEFAGAAPAAAAWLASTVSVAVLLDELSRSATRISELVESVKAFARMDEAPEQAVDIARGIRDTAALVLADLPVTVRWEIGSDLPPVPGDPGELNQLWSQLLANAADAVGRTGEITVRASRANGEVVVDVEDPGPGIPADLAGKVFEPFFTTKPPGHGTGMGLAVAYSIVQRHGGHIGLESRPGRTRMTVRLPAGNRM